jgi:hypothetical protein
MASKPGAPRQGGKTSPVSVPLVVLQKQFFGATELLPTSSVKLFTFQSEDFTNELNLAKHIPFR